MSKEPGSAESDPEIDAVDQMLETARKEIREFLEVGEQEDDPEDDPAHPDRSWAQLINILFEATGLEEGYSFFVNKADALGFCW